MKISFCIVVKNRLEHLKETLPINIKDNEDHPDVEFVVLDYNSSEDVDGWMAANYYEEMRNNKIIYFRENQAQYFMPSLARNICVLHSSGDVICTLDADNYTGPGFAKLISKIFNTNKPMIGFSKYMLNEYGQIGLTMGSSFGRIVMRKKDFVFMGGFDESFVYGWGYEDIDLVKRCLKAKFIPKKIPDKYLNYIQHSESERISLIDFSKLDALVDPDLYDLISKKRLSTTIHTAISDRNLSSNRLIANKNKVWGSGDIYKRHAFKFL